ncbi:ATP-binding protein [Streptomyces sp. NPDC059761]|uniref:ATP-binding protein n=1 Tax=Streptomyces sp. NPDC059761 TaxID=3346937 RepID=UPI00365402C5
MQVSAIVTSNELFGCWGEALDDGAVAAMVIDRLVHHAGGPLSQGESHHMQAVKAATLTLPRMTRGIGSRTDTGADGCEREVEKR